MTRSFLIYLRSAVTAVVLLTSHTLVFAKDASSQQSGRATDDSSPTLVNPVTYEVDFSAVVTPPSHTKVLKVWMPIPPSDRFQQIAKSELTTFPDIVKPHISSEPVYGNKFAYFEFHEPLGAQIIRHRFTATVNNVRWNVDPSRVQVPDAWPPELATYLKPDAITEAAQFQKVIRGFAPKPGLQATGLFAAMRWIDKNLTYDHVDASLRADTSHAFTKRHGHCSEYHGLCATMGRSLGFPTRVTYGLSLFPKNSPSHCKLDAFLPPYGWVSFDLSETQKMIQAIQSDESLDTDTKQRLALAARRRLVKGFRENSWLSVTRGTGYELAPKASRPVRVVRTIYAEADGEALPDPDPANADKREFGWMTVHAYKANKPVSKPFKELSSLDTE